MPNVSKRLEAFLSVFWYSSVSSVFESSCFLLLKVKIGMVQIKLHYLITQIKLHYLITFLRELDEMELIKSSVLVSLEECLCLHLLGLDCSGDSNHLHLFLHFPSFTGSGEYPAEETVVLCTYIECESRGSEELDNAKT